MQLKHLYPYIIILLISSCARVGTPTGGPKDEKPPISVSASPEFESVNFKGDKIRIYFDEYIKFKDLNKQLVISPPMKTTPEITPLGTASKFINIKILDTLKENSTYTFNFGNAVVDNAEGNVLKQFKYVFSTGSYIDSLSISGSVKDAYFTKTDKSIYVMLYKVTEKFTDSIIYKQKPDYIANTLDSTLYNITNIKEGKYLLLALKDKSNNMMYNPKEDAIGFLDNYIQIPTDSTYQLLLSKEDIPFKIFSPTEFSKNHLIMGYEGNWDVEITNVTDKNNNSVEFFAQKDAQKDSIHIWHKDISTDSIHLSVRKNNQVEDYYVRLRAKQQDSLKIDFSTKQVLNFRDTLSINSNIPIANTNLEKIKLIDNDSVTIPFRLTGSVNKDKLYLNFTKKPSTNYYLTLESGAFDTYLGQTNDSITTSFSVKKKEDYGELIIKMNLIENQPVIIQLLDEKLNVIQNDFIEKSEEITYDLLPTGKYTFRAIFDINNNKKWDSGVFLTKTQPEKVIYSPKIIDLRANWTINEEFNIQ